MIFILSTVFSQSLEKFFSVQQGAPTLLFSEEDIRRNNLQLIEKTLISIKCFA